MRSLKNAFSTRILIGIVTFATLLFVTMSTANANELMTQEEIEKLRANYIELGIDEKTGEKLIKKLRKGELLDSQKPEKLKGKNLTVDFENTEGNYIEFDDGSRIGLTFETEEEEPLFSTMGASTGTVSNRSCSSGSGYSYCNVTARYYDMIWDMKFDARVTRTSGRQTTISNVTNNRYEVVLYNIVDKHFGVVRSTSTSSTPAKARWQFQASHKAGLYSVTRDLALYANNSSTYARLEWN